MRKLLQFFDVNDFYFFSGLGLLGAGLWMVSIPLALSLVGGILMVVGFIGALRKGE